MLNAGSATAHAARIGQSISIASPAAIQSAPSESASAANSATITAPYHPTTMVAGRWVVSRTRSSTPTSTLRRIVTPTASAPASTTKYGTRLNANAADDPRVGATAVAAANVSV